MVGVAHRVTGYDDDRAARTHIETAKQRLLKPLDPPPQFGLPGMAAGWASPLGIHAAGLLEDRTEEEYRSIVDRWAEHTCQRWWPELREHVLGKRLDPVQIAITNGTIFLTSVQVELVVHRALRAVSVDAAPSSEN